MVGILAMAAAAAVEDYEIQPCKKLRREEEPPVKTITNYFSPLTKTVDKVFSPPRSNNIRDYFKTTPPTNKDLSSNVAKTSKSSQASNPSFNNGTPETPLSQTSAKSKRRGKRVNLQKRLSDLQQSETQSVQVISDNDSNEDTEAKTETMNTCILGSDTAALLAQICFENELEESSTCVSTTITCLNAEKMCSEHQKTTNDCKKARKRKLVSGKSFLQNISSKKQINEENERDSKDKHILAVVNESKSTINDSILSVSIDEASSLNDSVVTVSFEDFLKSQGESDSDKAWEAKASTLHNSIKVPEAEERTSVSRSDSIHTAAQLSLNTVTVLAQVHSSPPKPISVLKRIKTPKRIASIFLKKKDTEADRVNALSSESEHIEQMVHKRKSNVVIEEEELELAVLEDGNFESMKTKCTTEERQQFMKAFKQPTLETGKSGTKKTAGKLKDLKNKSKENEEMEINEDSINNCLENKKTSKTVKAEKRENTSEGKMKKQKKIVETNITNSDNSDIEKSKNKRHVKSQVKTDDLNDAKSPPLQKTNQHRVLRRSLRRQNTEIPKCNTIVKKAVFENDPDNGPLQVSSPKVKGTPISKNSFYKAEMITVSSESNSPIRMRFTRLDSNSTEKCLSSEAEEDFTPRSRKASGTNKKTSKAKKLIEKAKAIQHSISKASVETPTSLRRSSRQQVLAERKHLCESEDSGSSNTPKVGWKLKGQKKLRSLNDVLGKSTKSIKIVKSSSGKMKTASLFLVKKTQNQTIGAVTIIDESSQDVLENSEDDEQFKAKRVFLMSGLPDSLKRHIAKTAAAKEAYSVASSCFQTVTHVQQKDDGSPLWRLTWPPCPLLASLRHLNTGVTDDTKHSASLEDFLVKESSTSYSVSAVESTGWRMHFPEVVKKCLLDEIKSCNPQFPVRRFCRQFQQKQMEHIALSEVNTDEFTTCDSVYKQIMNSSDTEEENQVKRRKNKKIQDLKPKKKKPDVSVEDFIEISNFKATIIKSKRTSASEVKPEASIKGPLSQAARKKRDVHTTETSQSQDANVMVIEEEEKFEAKIMSDLTCEDVLWTEKYEPQASSELIGNYVAVKKLHSWLKEWKMRVDKEESRKQKEKRVKDKQQDVWDCSDFDDSNAGNEEEDLLCNTILITGPSGVGKTAAVYACAQELGFKVFEVNASCQRSGRQILAQLKEATQSHQVDKQGVNAHKPCLFNSPSESKSPGKFNSPKQVVASPRKPHLSPRRTAPKREPAPKILENYFKTTCKQKTNEEKVKLLEDSKDYSCKENEDMQAQVTKIRAQASDKVGSEEPARKSATSLILFEEVDVIFDDDSGFLNAIKTFMTTTKRPVILTTSDPTFSLMFDGCFEEINFKTPSLINVASYLQVLCLAENLRTDIKDFATMLAMNNCDIRQSILFLQFWVRSGGGYLKEKPLAVHGKTDAKMAPTACTADFTESSLHTSVDMQDLPKCDTGLVENLIGLKNIILPSEDLIFFVKSKITKREKWNKLIQLLTVFQMKNVNFIYSNLEFLLPLPVRILPELEEASELVVEKTTSVSSNTRGLQENRKRPLEGDQSAETSPVRTSSNRKVIVLDDSDLFECDSNSVDGSLTLPSGISILDSNESKEDVKLEVTELQHPLQTSSFPKENSQTPADRTCSALIAHCLDSLTEFVDNMSFLDCSLNADVKMQKEFCKNAEYNWADGKIKNGLCDGFSLENRDWWSTQSCAELKAVVEALSFHKCCSGISQSMETSLDLCRNLGKDPTEELTLYIPKHRDDVFFSQTVVNASVAQEKMALIKSVFSHRSFINMGNRQSSTIEYLPTLRSICKSEKRREQSKTKRRFLHYLEGIHLELPKATLNKLAADFP
ncbi:ATPase family AAA domain-containing protein 5 [Rhinatrema bivittatum]|uniref:ATPase family AAA domain-containing protein 5 n=1 Tax=Rhinatrema bivittatum TaxID=194408 RepID=UPI00112CF747|nr:ATPase family AAA domain-containing protein 5 [Rhinatrema bivittatum]